MHIHTKWKKLRPRSSVTSGFVVKWVLNQIYKNSFQLSEYFWISNERVCGWMCTAQFVNVCMSTTVTLPRLKSWLSALPADLWQLLYLSKHTFFLREDGDNNR